MDENQQEVSHPMRAILQNFSQTTTIHTISKHTSPVSLTRKLLWAVLFLFSFAYLTYEFVQLAWLYLSYPVSVVNTWEVHNRMEFPAVTVCNLNAFRKSKLPTQFYGELEKIFNDNANSEESENIVERIQSFASSLNVSVLKKIGHQQEDFIIDCRFQGISCKTSLNNFFSSSLGNCFTFNSMEKNRTRFSTKEGKSQALSLILNVETNQYVGALSPTVGVVVLVHDRGVAPFPQNEGLIISTGFTTNIGFIKEISNRLPKPYSEEGCKPTDTKLSYNGQTYNYSVLACTKGCVVKTSLEMCNCVPPEYRHKLACNPFNKTHQSCLKLVSNYLDKNLEECGCIPPCIETQYTATTSSAVWPSAASWIFLEPRVRNSSFSAYASNVMSARENLVHVNFFFSSFRIKTVHENRSYEFGSLIGDIGGQLGLFVGMSVLSLFEVFELFFDLFIKLVQRVKVKPISTSKRTGPQNW